MTKKKLPIKHVGIFAALCDGRKKANLRDDLGVERYKQLGVKERHLGEAPYRICPECIAAVPNAWKILSQRRARRDRRHLRRYGDHG